MALNMFAKRTGKSEKEPFRRAETLERVHGDLKKTLWFLDGPNKNFDGNDVSDTLKAGPISIPLTVSGDGEASAISGKLPVGEMVKTFRELDARTKPLKGVGYSDMTPEQRADFWMMLEDPYQLYLHSSYASVLASGLERHMFCGSFEEAYHVLLEMRNTQTDREFSLRSSNSLLLMAMYHNRPDLILQFQDSLDVDHVYALSEEVYLLSMYGTGMDLQARDIMRIAKSFGIQNTRYAMNYVPHFDRYLREYMAEQFGKETLPLKEFLDRADIGKLPTKKVPVFFNDRMSQQELTVPKLFADPELSRTVRELYKKAEQHVKDDLHNMKDMGLLLYDIDYDKREYVRDKDGYIIG